MLRASTSICWDPLTMHFIRKKHSLKQAFFSNQQYKGAHSFSTFYWILLTSGNYSKPMVFCRRVVWSKIRRDLFFLKLGGKIPIGYHKAIPHRILQGGCFTQLHHRSVAPPAFRHWVPDLGEQWENWAPKLVEGVHGNRMSGLRGIGLQGRISGSIIM